MKKSIKKLQNNYIKARRKCNETWRKTMTEIGSSNFDNFSVDEVLEIYYKKFGGDKKEKKFSNAFHKLLKRGTEIIEQSNISTKKKAIILDSLKHLHFDFPDPKIIYLLLTLDESKLNEINTGEINE